MFPRLAPILYALIVSFASVCADPVVLHAFEKEIAAYEAAGKTDRAVGPCFNHTRAALPAFAQ